MSENSGVGLHRFYCIAFSINKNNLKIYVMFYAYEVK
jgi:hypothetical protein